MFFKRRVKLFSFLIVIIIAIGFFQMSAASGRFFSTAKEGFHSYTANHGFALRDVIVKGGERVDRFLLEEAVRLDRGMPILSVDINDIQEQIVVLDWVDSVRVRRVLPDRIFVEITELEPYAVWHSPEGVQVLIDRDGVAITFNPEDISDFPDLIRLRGMAAPNYAEAFLLEVSQYPEIYDNVVEAKFINERRWTLVMKGGTQILLPQENIDLALESFETANAQQKILEKNPAGIDLRQTDRIIITNRDNVESDVQTIPLQKPETL